MDVAGLSHERPPRAGAARRSNGSRDRAARPARGTIRSESVRAGQGSPLSALAMDGSAADADPVAAAPDTADHLQAGYFLRLLTQNRRLIDHRIDEYRKAIATSEAKCDVDAAGNLRRMMRTEEQDRQTLDALIEQLRRRFPRPAPRDVQRLLRGRGLSSGN